MSEPVAEIVAEGSDAKRWFEVTVHKTMAEESLSALRMHSFQVDNISTCKCSYIRYFNLHSSAFSVYVCNAVVERKRSMCVIV